MTPSRPVALIPAYKPAPVLVDIAAALMASEVFEAVICVDDGGGEAYAPLFRRLEEMGVEVLHHAVNLGKGQAYCSASFFPVPEVRAAEHDPVPQHGGVLP